MELGDLESYQGQFILITVIFLKIKICFEPIDGYLPDMYVNIILVALRHLMFLVTSTSFLFLHIGYLLKLWMYFCQTCRDILFGQF